MAWRAAFEIAMQRMNRALREFRIRGVKTNMPFLENVIENETFRTGKATTRLIDTTPELFDLLGLDDFSVLSPAFKRRTARRSRG